MRWRSILSAIALASACALAQANEVFRPSTFAERGGREMDYVHVPNAVVAWADYAALRRDFPKLRALDDRAIDTWILENFAFVSKLQLLLMGVRMDHQDVSLEQLRKLLVPQGYGRAAVAEAILSGEKLGLVDLKGTGHTDETKVRAMVEEYQAIQAMPEGQEKWEAIDALLMRHHSNGVVSLAEGFAEVDRQKAVQAEFDLKNAREGTFWQTVECYFNIQLPFHIIKPHGGRERMAIIGRQAHYERGVKLKNYLDDKIYSDMHGGKQGTALASAVDFGGATPEREELKRTFGDPKETIRPIKRKSGEIIQMKDPEWSKVWKYTHELARAFIEKVGHDEREARSYVLSHIREMLSPLEEKLSHLKPLSEEETKFRALRHLIQLNRFSSLPVIVRRLASEFQQQPAAKRLELLKTRPADPRTFATLFALELKDARLSPAELAARLDYGDRVLASGEMKGSGLEPLIASVLRSAGGRASCRSLFE